MKPRPALWGAVVVVPLGETFAQTFQDVTLEAFAAPPVHKHLDTSLGLTVMTGGLGVGDFNRDGHQDLFVVRGQAAPDELWLNRGDGTFHESGALAGVAHLHRGSGVLVGDFDADGWVDIYVTSLGSEGAFETGANRLYRNLGLGADGITPVFEEVAEEAGVRVVNPYAPDGFGAAFGDYDLDGDLDLAVAGWNGNVCPDGPDPHARPKTGTRLFRNEGDGTFTDVTAEATPLNVIECWPDDFEQVFYIEGFAPRFADMNNDRYPDLLITADHGWTSEYLRTSLYLRNNADGTFTNMTDVPGVGLGLDSNGMGQAVGDLDHDGDLDWYVTSICDVDGPTEEYSCNVLYLNNGDDTFTEIAGEVNVWQGFWGWGTEIIDANLDAFPDIVETNGWGSGLLSVQPTRFFRSNGLTLGGELRPFTPIEAEESGLAFAGLGRALVRFDYDNDGDIDLVLLPNSTLPASLGQPDQPLVLYRNLTRETAPPGGASWLRVFLDTSTHPCLVPEGIGARVEVSAPGLPAQVQEISPGSTFNSSSEASAHFGLGEGATTCDVRVLWPNGRVTELAGVEANRTLTLSAPCAADVDGDGVLNVLDLVAFQGAFVAGDTTLADVDCDAGLSIQDFLRFQILFAAGCD